MPLKERFSASERSSEPHLRLPRDPKVTGGMWVHEEPLIERLAQTASLNKPIPTAGWVGIQRAKEPDVEVPPECMLYEADRKKFTLGHVPPHRVKEALGSEDLETLKALALDDAKDAQRFAKDQKKLVTPKITSGKVRDKLAAGKGGVAAAGKSTQSPRTVPLATAPAAETAAAADTAADKKPGTPGTAVKNAYKAKSNNNTSSKE